MVKKWSQVIERYDIKKYLDHCRAFAVGFDFYGIDLNKLGPRLRTEMKSLSS